MANKKISELFETTNVQNDDYIMIVQDGVNKKVKATHVKQVDNLTTEYLELLSKNGNKYRGRINDNGKFIISSAEADTATTPLNTDNQLFWGLIINQIYGGGSSLIDTVITHSFIELYNTKNISINLKGLYLWYKTKSGLWESFALNGIIPPYHSFLIRCGLHTDFHKDFVRCHIDKYDQQWDIKLSNQGFSIYLCIGAEPINEDNPLKYNKDVLGNIISINPRYIDLISAGGKDPSQGVVAYEGRYWNCMDENTALHRIDFAYGNNNQVDCEALNYLTCNVNIYKPRCLSDGEWSIYYNKIGLKKTCPNMINISYGETGDTSRTFTWQSVVTDEGYLKYRKQGSTTWTKVETIRELVRHKDSDATIHRVIIRNLTPGIYEYQAGEEGLWSDLETFEVKTYTQTDRIKFLWTTDQQGFTETEYNAWKTAIGNILNWETFDWHLNTGDISQNANKSHEWRYYFKHSGRSTRNMCHELTCGNNDLIDKKYSDAFNYYGTYENKAYNSVYAWDLGYTHFVCLNSNTDFTEAKNFNNSTDAFTAAQCTWLDEHLTQVKARTTKPRWIVCYMHVAPFTVVRMPQAQRFIAVFEKHKVNLVLCGHNHAFSKSKALYTEYNGTSQYNDYITKIPGTSDLKIVNEFKADGTTPINRANDTVNGTVYIMCQATGYKLSGKEKPITLPTALRGTMHDNGNGAPWWVDKHGLPTNPTYGIVDIGYNDIKIDLKCVNGVISTDVLGNITVNPIGTQVKYDYDSTTITYNQRW